MNYLNSDNHNRNYREQRRSTSAYHSGGRSAAQRSGSGRTARRPGTGRSNSSGNRERRGRGPKFRKQRHIIGIASFALAVIFLFMATLAGLIFRNGGLGFTALLPAIFIAASGYLAISMEHRVAPAAFIYPAGLAFLADFFCMIHVKGIGAWRFLGVLCAVICLLHLIFLCMFKRRNIEMPKLLMVICAAFTIIFLIIGTALGGKSQTTDADASADTAATTDAAGDTSADTSQTTTPSTATTDSTGAATAAEGQTTDTTSSDTTTSAPVVDVQDPNDGTLFLSTDTFAVHFNRYELGTDVNGAQCVYIYYDFTNRSSQSESIPSVSYSSLTQNGEACSKASVAESNTEMDNYKSEVASGATVTACEVYSIADMSDCEFEIMEFVPANAKSATMTIALKEEV